MTGATEIPVGIERNAKCGTVLEAEFSDQFECQGIWWKKMYNGQARMYVFTCERKRFLPELARDSMGNRVRSQAMARNSP
jgi:hypothetical protein